MGAPFLDGVAGRAIVGDRGHPARIPSASAWKPWSVMPRARGWHVSRETSDGTRREFLLNEVRRVRIFRSLSAATLACARANFDVEAKRLAAEPLLNPAGATA